MPLEIKDASPRTAGTYIDTDDKLIPPSRLAGLQNVAHKRYSLVP